MSFRPLIRGFFFYVLKCVQHYSEENKAFPSPYSGILFLSYGGIAQLVRADALVSVPLFGDSFFMGGSILMQRKIRCRKFPSPHSGILFLCENRRVPPGGKTGRVSVPSFGDSFFIMASA